MTRVPPVERAPVAATTRRSSDLIVQSIIAGIVCIAATVATVSGALSGDALASIFALSLGYVFGVGNGLRIARAPDDNRE